jgi:palmitoyl transferase
MKIFLALILFFFNISAMADSSCHNWPSWFQPACNRLESIWTDGDNELYLTGYAWHNRYTYSPEKVRNFNENAWGGGIGKGLYDEKGNWHGLYAFAFMDSHDHVEPIAGYSYLKTFPLGASAKIGLGVTVLITSRVDIYHSIPFPGALPWLSLNYKQISLGATYIPGAKGAGNVLFLVGKYTFKNT